MVYISLIWLTSRTPPKDIGFRGEKFKTKGVQKLSPFSCSPHPIWSGGTGHSQDPVDTGPCSQLFPCPAPPTVRSRLTWMYVAVGPWDAATLHCSHSLTFEGSAQMHRPAKLAISRGASNFGSQGTKDRALSTTSCSDLAVHPSPGRRKELW